MEPMFYTVTDINGDYAQLMGDQGHEHSITMFLLPEGTTVGSRLKLENFIWTLEEKNPPPPFRRGCYCSSGQTQSGDAFVHESFPIPLAV